MIWKVDCYFDFIRASFKVVGNLSLVIGDKKHAFTKNGEPITNNFIQIV